MTMVFASGELPSRDELVRLYDSVGWSAYTADPDLLEAAMAVSLRVTTARVDGHLVGLARVVGDGLTIVYLQDILVNPAHHRSGIGRRLLDEVLAPYASVRQKVLLTDTEPAQRAFYEATGFVEAHDHQPGLRAFVRFD
ncbi:GNAT family N-acetyltransferase [Tessaracoccus caeni]|uniref:GNAT family N-acetyltransferase n=1 Tax=Tessaracoccus caeni TaxID=3031239 RepID=UPI0023D9E8B3|nr:GNAT family N-acetyltransferase [Tessaracoccus caeni]MDF1488953.1 GNAT family N-acetyltransferase [Tessaracoccus caeni]